jgi:SAM-dependent methyltransferase
MPPVTVTWPAAAEAVTVQVTCPNCGNNRPKALRLSMMFETPGHPQRHSRLLNCPACGCSFYERQLPPDYQDPEFLTKGRVPFYLQQGAGLSLITRPLARCRSGAGAAYLEVGCGFGFGVDYALHAKQWVARGIDPGEISVLGAELLKLSIDVRYLSDEEAAFRQSFDVVMASETIEHVPSPERFVSTLRNVLRPGGMLILTTPDAADLNEHTTQSSLIGLLSPGLHLIFQTANSLRDLLLSRGFRHVAIEKDGHSLVAFASDTAFALQDDEGRVREEYRTYLERRSEDPSLGRDLFFAFAGRAMQESVNDGCFDQARRVRQQIGFACVKHFGRDLQELGVQAQLLAESDLEQLSRKVPLNLGGLLYADAMLQLADGTSRRDMMEAFDQAAFAAETLIRAVGELAMGDALSAAIAWQAQAEAALCAAAVGHASITHRLQTLETRGQVGSLQSSEITLRAFVGLVNGEHYELAHQLLETLSPNALDWADPDSSKMLSPVERDAAYCLSVLEVQGSNPITLDVSRRRFARLKTLLEWHDNLRTPGLYEGVLRGEQLAAEKLSAESQASDPQSPAPRSPVAESALRALPSDGPKLPILAKCGPVTAIRERLGRGRHRADW